MYKSETSKFRNLLEPFCKGKGLDIGYGGDPVTETAITVDLEKKYANCGDHPLNIAIPEAFVDNEYFLIEFFCENSLDYIYSSHLLEDFSRPEDYLRVWQFLLKPNGYLILLLPDEKEYRSFCEKNGKIINHHHKNENFNLKYVSNLLKMLDFHIVHESDRMHSITDDSYYNFSIVARKKYER